MQHQLPNLFPKLCDRLRTNSNRKTINSRHSAQQGRPIFNHYLIFLTFIFLGLELTYFCTLFLTLYIQFLIYHLHFQDLIIRNGDCLYLPPHVHIACHGTPQCYFLKPKQLKQHILRSAFPRSTTIRRQLLRSAFNIPSLGFLVKTSSFVVSFSKPVAHSTLKVHFRKLF